MMHTLTAADGHRLDCWINNAQGTARGGLVMLQEIFGVTDQLKGLAKRYAQLGYDVAIPALFDRSQPGSVISFDQAPAGRELAMAAKPVDTLLDIQAAVKALADRGLKVAVMGFCWGGGLAVRAAQKLPVEGAIAFYGTRLPQYLDAPLKAPLLAHFGQHDEHTPKETIDQVKAFFPDMEMHLYDTGHAFANDARPAVYNRASAELAHERSVAFLKRVIG